MRKILSFSLLASLLVLTSCTLPGLSGVVQVMEPSEEATSAPLATATLTLTVEADDTTARVTPSGEDVNCRFGPSRKFLTTGALLRGESAEILGALEDHSWWQIEDPRHPGRLCWVGASVTTASGDLVSLPILPFPTGLVTDLTVAVSSGAILHGFCGGPNAVNFEVSVTTNGPAAVVYGIDIFNGNGTLRNSPADATLTFLEASTQTFDPGGAYHTDCGSFYIVASVSSPNALDARADWSVVNP